MCSSDLASSPLISPAPLVATAAEGVQGEGGAAAARADPDPLNADQTIGAGAEISRAGAAAIAAAEEVFADLLEITLAAAVDDRHLESGAALFDAAVLEALTHEIGEAVRPRRQGEEAAALALTQG